MVLMFASVMTAGSQPPMVSSIQSASTLINAKMAILYICHFILSATNLLNNGIKPRLVRSDMTHNL